MMFIPKRLFFATFLGLLMNGLAHGAVGIVKDISIHSDGDIDVPEVIKTLGVAEKEAYQQSQVERGLSRLAESGKYQGVRSFFDRSKGTLTVELKLLETLSVVEVTCEQCQNQEQQEQVKNDILEVVGVSSGDAVYVELFAEIRSRILARLADRGYLGADVVLAIEQVDQTSNRKLLVGVKLGQRIRIRGFKLIGFENKDVEEFLKYLKEQGEIEQFLRNLKITDLFQTSKNVLNKTLGRQQSLSSGAVIPVDVPLDWISISKGIAEWSSESRTDGYYDFALTANPLDESRRDNTVIVQISLVRGLRYNVQFKNNVQFWERDLRTKVLDRTLRLGVPFNTAEAEANVLRLYQALGYKDAKIQTRTMDSEGERRIDFRLEEGPRYFLGKVALEGISDADAVDLNTIIDEWLEPMESPLHRTYYDEPLIKSRLSELLRLIRKKGFLKARILEFRPTQEENSSLVNVEISIQLGPKYFIRSVTVLGNTVLSEKELDRLVTFEPGRAIDPDLLKDISKRLTLRYQDLGFPYVKVVEDEKKAFLVKSESTDVDIQIEVDPGPQVRIGRIVVRGLKKTKEEVVLREIQQLKLKTGEKLHPTQIQIAEQRLTGLGIFSSARFEAVGGRVLEKAQTQGTGIEKQEKDLRVQVTEQNAGAFEFGPGFRSELGVVGFAEFNYRNLSGMNRGTVLRAQVSRKIRDFEEWEQKYSASFLEPFINFDPTRLRFNVSYELDDQYSYNSNDSLYDRTPVGGFIKSEVSFGLSAEREIFENFRITQNVYTFSLPRIINQVDASRVLTVEEKGYRIGTIGTTFSYDSRDNLFNPTRGNLGSLSYEYSAPWLASDSDAHFVIGRILLGKYFPFADGLVLAVNASYAKLFGLGNTSGVPENKLFTLGGRASIRSIEEGALKSLPGSLVSQQSTEFKFELRQPLFLDIVTSAFVDVGRLDALSYRDSTAPNSSGWQSGFGFGFKYNLPVGPIGFDFAMNPNAGSVNGGSKSLTILFSFGTF